MFFFIVPVCFSFSVLLLLPGQRLLAGNRRLRAGTAAFFLHQRRRHSCSANRDVVCCLWVFHIGSSRTCHNCCSTVALACIYHCFYGIKLQIISKLNLRINKRQMLDMLYFTLRIYYLIFYTLSLFLLLPCSIMSPSSLHTCPFFPLKLRHNREDFRGEEGPVRRLHR